MFHPASNDLILNNPRHIVDGFEVTAEQVQGPGVPPDVYERGKYKMFVDGFPTYADDRGEIMQRNVERILQQFPNTGIEFGRVTIDENEEFSGDAKIRFKTIEGRLGAKQAAIEAGWGVPTFGRHDIKYRRRIQNA
ncbi:hypothetical protein Tco_0740837 [Tanacetum coccineum]